MNHESIRRSFRPPRISVLFVGESRPVSGGFFYVDSPMTGYMQRVFSSVFSIKFRSREEFLEFFKAKGCYLDDLSLAPVDNGSRRQRRLIVDAGIGPLALRIREYQPKFVVAVLKRIAVQVRKAAQQAEFRGPIEAVPFPGQSHQSAFVRELSAILEPIYKRK